MNRKIKEYIIVGNWDPMHLSINVNDKIKEGYEPIGGIATSKGKLINPKELEDLNSEEDEFYQAMVKYEE